MKVGDLVRSTKTLPGHEPSICIVVEFCKMAGSIKLWRVMQGDGRTSLWAENITEVINESR